MHPGTPQPALFLLALLPLLAGCGAQDPRAHHLEQDIARLEQEIRTVEASISGARTERGQLDAQLEGAMLRLAEKMRRRIPGQDQVYLELDVEQVGGLARSFLSGLEGAGSSADLPYRWTLGDVHSRSHRERIMLSGSYTMTYGGRECAGPTAGYLLHLDRELLKVQDLQLACTTPQGKIELLLGDRLAPMPLPVTVVRQAALAAAPGTSLPTGTLELITPLQATFSPERLRLSATTVSLRGVAR